MPDSPLQTRSDLVASSALRYQIVAGRYGQHVSNQMAAALAAMQQELIGRVATMPESWSRDRLEQMIAELGAIMDSGFNRLNASLTDELRGFAQISADAQLNALDAALQGQPWPAGSLREPPAIGNPIQMTLAAPAPEAVWAAVTAQPFVGTFMADSWQRLNDLARERIETGVRQGFMQGETLQQVINRIRGTKDQAGAMELTRRNAETWARTAVNHISNQAREAVYAENDDVVKGVVWVATLDHRTCPKCGALDGKVFQLDKPHPSPPDSTHWSCRCLLAPALKSYGEIMGGPASPSVPGTRSAMGGEVPGNWNYGDWLKAQDRDFIASVVGKKRVQAFLNGEFDVSIFVPDAQAMSLEKLTKIFTKEKPLVPGFPI